MRAVRRGEAIPGSGYLNASLEESCEAFGIDGSARYVLCTSHAQVARGGT